MRRRLYIEAARLNVWAFVLVAADGRSGRCLFHWSYEGLFTSCDELR